MPDNNDQLRDNEVKMIRLVERLETISKDCSRVSERIERDMVTHDKLKLVQQELNALRKEVEKATEGHTWLWRGLFGAMLSTAAGLVAFLIQKG